MKKLFSALLLIILASILLLAAAIFAAVQSGDVSKSDLAFLVDLGERDGIGAVIYVVKTHLFGADLSNASDPSYGRELVEGRGNAPWVVRSNLDDRPRVLLFALAPDFWAAYEVERMSLYQVWRGEVNFAGAAYNYDHGPQPSSAGEWFVRDESGARWFLEVEGTELPAQVNYLGHAYAPGRKTAAMRFKISAGEHELTLNEWPDLTERDGQQFLTRRFESDADSSLRAVFYDGHDTRHRAEGTVEILLDKTQEIVPITGPEHGQGADASEVERGESVIAGSDCLSCHGEHHRVTGPAWSQISGKFRGKIQTEVVSALSRSVLEGSVGTWGQVPMPPHPTLSAAEAREAVVYILSVGEPEGVSDPPVNATGNPYAATYDYDILPKLTALHPSFELQNVAPEGFEPKVGGMSFRSDGKMVLASWDLDGGVFLIDPHAPAEQRVKRIAEGLHEPLGLVVVEDRTYVMQKQELTELVDTDGDDIIDEYRVISNDWQANPNFHSFAFGLVHQDDAFYFLLSICVLPGGASCPEQLPAQGKLLRADAQGNTEVYASGFRTPNGISTDHEGAIYVADNQGDWLPSSKLVRVNKGDFFGSRAVPDENVMALEEMPPALWLPQDEVGNSPTQPLELTDTVYASQFIFGDVYNGGIKRAFLEEIEGQLQGAAFHFSVGFNGAVNRLTYGPDGSIYVGGTGNPPNWGEFGKLWHGLERLTWQGNNAFEILAVRAQDDGFEIELTQPLAASTTLSGTDLIAKQWFYHPNEQYGGPKYDEQTLSVASLELSSDRRSIRARIGGLKTGHVVYLRLNNRLLSETDQSLWTAEAWYTLNRIPGGGKTTTAAPAEHDGWRALFDGSSLEGWRNYGHDTTEEVEKWRVEDGALTLMQEGAFPMWGLIKSVVFGGGSSDLIYYREKFKDFELSLEWKISENGNSGIFYLVADEEEKTPWLTGIEMQVLHNEGHSDGEIETHRAGDLYDLIAADPETVLPPGQWNKVRIRIQNNRIEHWLNGTKVVEVERASKEWNALVAASKFADMPLFGKSDSGYIVLQDHGDPVWYRNIKVRNLPAE